MDAVSVAWPAAALVLAAIAGLGAGSLLVRRSSKRTPGWLAELVAGFDAPALLLGSTDAVLAASRSGETLLTAQGTLQPPVAALVASARQGAPAHQDLSVPRGPYGEGEAHLLVHVAAAGGHRMLLVTEDRTAARRLDEVRRDFIANVSHELKTPIGAVGLLAEAVHAAATEPEQVRRFAAQLEAESTRLGNMTSDLIELTRLEAAGAMAGSERLRMADVLEEAVAKNRVAAAAKGIRIVIGKTKRAEVSGDRGLLAMALANLVANAVVYSPQGSRIGMGVRVVHGMVEIAVTDRGDGIAPADRERVFERFYRTDRARSRSTGGSGLGLAIAKHVVQNHGGEIRLWSQVGRGSTFTVRLPEARPEEEQ